MYMVQVLLLLYKAAKGGLEKITWFRKKGQVQPSLMQTSIIDSCSADGSIRE